MAEFALHKWARQSQRISPAVIDSNVRSFCQKGTLQRRLKRVYLHRWAQNARKASEAERRRVTESVKLLPDVNELLLAAPPDANNNTLQRSEISPFESKSTIRISHEPASRAAVSYTHLTLPTIYSV
eukprot:TRINITY_DN4268_c0_g1_i4.p1 TRINITY_DN4268_c0_g1~~TRINITY_DN4268_c0_g1_i4.p1  ORF type:complete len:127 (+),score=8.33 TRINITY_DN4268_c0_g1_i4:252-632(+)